MSPRTTMLAACGGCGGDVSRFQRAATHPSAANMAAPSASAAPRRSHGIQRAAAVAVGDDRLPAGVAAFGPHSTVASRR